MKSNLLMSSKAISPNLEKDYDALRSSERTGAEILR